MSSNPPFKPESLNQVSKPAQQAGGVKPAPGKQAVNTQGQTTSAIGAQPPSAPSSQAGTLSRGGPRPRTYRGASEEGDARTGKGGMLGPPRPLPTGAKAGQSQVTGGVLAPARAGKPPVKSQQAPIPAKTGQAPAASAGQELAAARGREAKEGVTRQDTTPGKARLGVQDGKSTGIPSQESAKDGSLPSIKDPSTKAKPTVQSAIGPSTATGRKQAPGVEGKSLPEPTAGQESTGAKGAKGTNQKVGWAPIPDTNQASRDLPGSAKEPSGIGSSEKPVRRWGLLSKSGTKETAGKTRSPEERDMGSLGSGRSRPAERESLEGPGDSDGVNRSSVKGGMVTASWMKAKSEEPMMMGSKMLQTYNHKRFYHWTNPLIVRTIETVLAITMMCALIVADLPLKAAVWIHLSMATPTIPIAALFGVAALYHRNPIEPVFTLILLGASLFCYVSSISLILDRWLDIKRNRGNRPTMWLTILGLNAIMILTIIVDIMWYISLLITFPWVAILERIRARKRGDSKKTPARKSGTKEGNKGVDADSSSVYSLAKDVNIPQNNKI